jgi:membrane-bound ClpP family serine protease
MVSTQKLQLLLIPALLLTALGTLQILFPHALEGYAFDIPEKRIGIIFLVIETFLVLTWGKIEGAILILMALGLISLCFLGANEEPEAESEPTLKQKATVAAAGLAWRAGKKYVTHRHNRRNNEKSM